MKSLRVSSSGSQSWGAGIPLEDRFGAMVANLEQAASRNGAGYRRRVAAAGLLGYVVLGVVLAVLAGLALLMLGVLLLGYTAAAGLLLKLAFVCGLIAFAILRALWLKRPKAEGVPIDRAGFAAMFAMVDRIRASTRGPTVHEIRLTDAFNAAVTQEPRFIVWGSRNTLYLGIPLLLALPAQEVEAVIAHEFGHFVGRHGRTAGFVYGVRMRWAQVAEQLPTGIVGGILGRFFRWYGPWFAAYSFVLARQQEYEADQLGARLTREKAMGHALTRVALRSATFGEIWSAIWSQAPLRTDLPASPYHMIAEAFGRAWDHDARILQDALHHESDPSDTHPSLAQRLAALGHAPALPPPFERSAADDLLGDSRDSTLDRFDADWRSDVAPKWQAIFDARQGEIAERDRLAERSAAGLATAEEMFEHALLVEQIDGPAAGAALYAALLAGDPDNASLHFRLGDCLLAGQDDAGIDHLARVATEKRALATHAYWRIIGHLHANDRAEEAARYQEMLAAAVERDRLAAEAAETIDAAVILKPLHLDADKIQLLRDRLADIGGLRDLHAVSRRIDHHDQPQIVFTFRPQSGTDARLLLDLLLEAVLPHGDAMGLEESADRKWLTKKVRDIAGSQLFP